MVGAKCLLLVSLLAVLLPRVFSDVLFDTDALLSRATLVPGILTAEVRETPAKETCK